MPAELSSVPSPDPLAVIEEFKRLYHAARREHNRAGKNATADSPAHQAAFQHAREHQIPGAEGLLEALPPVWNKSEANAALKTLDEAKAALPETLKGQGEHVRGMLLSKLGRHAEAIECYQKALATPGYDTPGAALNNLGVIYADKDDLGRAIECYQQALTTSGYDTPGYALYNMGMAYAAKGQHDRAIAWYLQALASPGYDTPGAALNNMGSAYVEKDEYDRAIECYQQALTTPSYDTPGNALNNMGLAYANKGEHGRAIECYQKALASPGHGKLQLTRLNYADSLRELGNLNGARSLVEGVLAETDTDNNHSQARYLKNLIEDAQAGIKPSAAEEALAKSFVRKDNGEADSPEARIVEKLQGSNTQQRDKYDQYLRREGGNRNDVFSCLRGWSSAVTLLEGGQDTQWKGGGYFLKWLGRGIVIDPGFDFLDNFHDAGYNGREIDAVLVSHNHPDHKYDLESIDDLRFELHRRWKVMNMEKPDGLDLSKCLFVIDQDTSKAFKDNSPDHRRTPLKFDRANYEHQRWLERANGLPLILEHFPVDHGADVPNAVGMRLRLLGEDGMPRLVLGYTGDTEYSEDLVNHLIGCDLLLAHISMPDNEEYTDDKHLKKRHLGYNGLAKLIAGVKPKLTLVGEFWAGLADLRIELTQGLRRRAQTQAIIPTGLGLHLHLPDLEVECTSCTKRVPHDRIKIAPAASPFGPLGYLCERCLI